MLLLQRLWITFELFRKKGLANHAAAGAYGFLLSAAPVLLIISFFVSRFLADSPESVAALFQHIGFLSGIFNVSDFIRNFLRTTNSGLAGVISVITVLWTTRLCALSIQRGIRVIFPRSLFRPFRAAVITLLVGFLIIFFIFIILLGSRVALNFFDFHGFPLGKKINAFVSIIPIRLFHLLFLTLMTLTVYRFVPSSPPKWKHIIPGLLACMVFYQVFSAGFTLLIGPDRYNLLYGALGRLFLFLVNVYFYFFFFFFGAQLILVLGSSDVLLFVRFRQLHSHNTAPKKPWDKIFASPPNPLKKYSRFFRQGEFVFYKGHYGQEVYYVLSGEAGVYLDDECLTRIALIDRGHFFGEMEYVSPFGRSASIKAETDLFVMILPPEVFREILQSDPETDQHLIKTLSDRLRSVNEKVVSSASPRAEGD